MKFFPFGHKKENSADKSNAPTPSKTARAVAAGAGAVGLAIGGVAATGEAPKPADSVVTVGGSPTPENPGAEVTAPTTSPTTEAPTSTTPSTEAPVTTTTAISSIGPLPGETPGLILDGTTPTSMTSSTSITAPGLTDPNQAPAPTVPKDPQSQLPSST